MWQNHVKAKIVHVADEILCAQKVSEKNYFREGFKKKSDFYHFGVWPPLESDKNIFYFFGY